MCDLKRYAFRLARTTQEQRDAFGGADLGFLSEDPDGELCLRAEVVADFAASLAGLEAALPDLRCDVLTGRIAALEAEVVDLYKLAMRCLREEPSDTTYIAASSHVKNAIGEISARRAVIEWERDEARKALRELVEDIDDNAADHELPDGRVEEWRVLSGWSTCPKCDDDPEESIGLCPYHEAKRLLGGDGG